MKPRYSMNAKLLSVTVSLLTAITLFIFLSSFQKTVESNKVKSETNISDTIEKFLYTYDSTGRLIVSEYRKQNIKRTYDYGIQDSIIITDWSNNGHRSRQAWLIDIDGHLLKGLNVKHTYDQHGFLIESVYDLLPHVRKEVFTIFKGDIIKRQVLDDGKVTAITNYTYFNFPDNKNYGQSFRGQRSVHLEKTKTEHDKGTTKTSTYSYTFDNFGRVITKTVSCSDSSSTWAYTYVD